MKLFECNPQCTIICLITLPFKRLGLFNYLHEITIFIMQELIQLKSDRKQNILRFLLLF